MTHQKKYNPKLCNYGNCVVIVSGGGGLDVVRTMGLDGCGRGHAHGIGLGRWRTVGMDRMVRLWDGRQVTVVAVVVAVGVGCAQAAGHHSGQASQWPS